MKRPIVSGCRCIFGRGSEPLIIVIGIFIASRFKITPETHPILMDEIKRLKEGGRKEDVDPEVKQVCEDLTGHPYERLYTKL